MKRKASTLQFISPLVVWALFCINTVFAEPPSTVNAPITSSLKSAIQSIFTNQTSVETVPVETVKDDSLFRVELGSLEYLDSNESPLNTEALKSKKVLVYFWSIYCHGCIAPMKELEELRAALKESGIEVITVHLFESDKVRLMNRLAQLSLGLPVLFGPNEIRDLFSVRVLPTAVAFDDKHRMIARFDGNFSADGISLKLTQEMDVPNKEAREEDSNVTTPLPVTTSDRVQ